jgi:hypothetical protein
MFTGEGDFGNVYKHVRFDALVQEDTRPYGDWLTGRALRAGDRLRNGEVVMLYQWRDEAWHFVYALLEKTPGVDPR